VRLQLASIFASVFFDRIYIPAQSYQLLWFRYVWISNSRKTSMTYNI